ncbi:MAG TPA: META domain-containing protein, partial [Ornithinibacter sp.]|nr:META domain-containing protein [Ornithinibacter sp.]
MRDVRTFLVVGGVVALVAVGALAGSLASGGGDSANGSVPVDDVGRLAGSWLVVNDASAPAVTIGAVRLDFSDDGRLTAWTGCNGLRGQVSVDDSVLVAGPLVSTRMACAPPLMEQERWITEMLGSRPRLEQSGPYLYLHWGEGEQWWVGL